MADAKIEKQKVQEITDKLEEGLKELFESEKYKTYLNTMSKFHNYSFNNTLLIAMQKPDATLVAGYKAWQKQFERHVMRGEKGIRILAPAPYKIKEEQEKIDPVTNEPMLDKDGMPVMEEVEIKIPAFRAVTVFDVSQTDGKELPEIGVSELSAQVEGYQNFMKALEMVSPVPIGYEDIPGEAKGYYHTSEKRVAIQQGMSESQTVKTAIHEVAHAKLHSRELSRDTDLSERKDRNTKEVEAESVAYTVCQHFGIDTTDYSFGYIAGWSSGKEMTELKSSLDTIRRTASELISGIETQLRELEKDIAIEETQDIVLLVTNTDRSEYDLVNVRGMEREELFNSLLAMTDDDRLSVEAYLEGKGGWVTPLADEQSEDVQEYHLDYVYNTDTKEITDVKAVQQMQENKQEPMAVSDTAVEYENLPDENIGLSEMQEYGYTWSEMLPLTKEKALELFDHNLTLYQLHNDGSESFIDDRDMIMDHEGVFGIEKGDWEQYVKLRDTEHELEENEANREALLLYGRDNQFGIYQLGDTDVAQDMRFMNSDFHEMKSVAIARENYKLVYTAPLEAGTGLEDIYQTFNIDRPEDFRGHSLSVSDVVVLHQNGENTFHFVDSVGYKEVPEFMRETEQELQEEQTSHIEEATEILEEIAEEYTGEEPERENAVFLVNYNEWREVSELDLEQNYFAIDDPYGDGDFRLLWLQNEIKDITPAEVQYDTYEEAAQALSEVEREVANLPHNKENGIGSYMVNGKAQLDMIAEARSLQKHLDMESDKVSYYVIADLSTWAENSLEKSKLERFDSLEEALAQFKVYRGKDAQFTDDKARTTLGVSVQGMEFDVIHVRNNENVLSLDFTHSSTAKQSNRFRDDLQILCNELVDKVRVHRDMSPEEVKDFVKERFAHQLRNGGLDDISVYMERFDTLYDQGKMEHLMPTANQRHMVDDIPLVEWENEYISINNRYADIADKELSVVEYQALLGMEISQVSVDGLMEIMNFEGELWNYPMEEKEHCLQENIPVVTVCDGEEARYFEIPEELVAKVRESEFRGYEPEQTEHKEAVAEKTVTLTVAECGEFHNLGEFHEGIVNVDEAIAIYNQIPSERMNGVKSIGINIHTEGTEAHEDVQMDIVSGKVADLEILDYVPDISDEPKAVAVIGELIDKLPDIEVRGSLERLQIGGLATEIDQFSYDFDTHQYRDTVEDRAAQIATIAEDIRNGNTGYLNDFLNAVIAEGVRNGITDMFGQGVEPEDSEAIQNMRKAKELSDRLSEYKPLAKVEELTEGNYNMVDNVLNNGAEKKEQEQMPGRISIKEKLAEKKAVIERKDKPASEKDAEKKTQREM